MWNCLELIMYFGLLMIWTEVSSTNNVKIVRPPKDYFPKSGSLQLVCEAEGNPLPSIVWYDAQTMTVVEEEPSIGLKIFKDIGLLMIQRPVQREIYEFYCNASNDLHWVMSSTVKTGTAFLTSKFKVEPLSLQIIKPLQSALFSCKPPSGVPFPKVHWLKDKRLILGKILSKDKNRIFFVNNEKIRSENEVWSLKITKSTVMDSGRYQCVATNDHGRVESSGGWLIVTNNLETPLGIKIENYFIILNQEVSFPCETDPRKNTRWISSNDMTKNSRITLTPSMLIIKEVHGTDKGLYGCETNTGYPELLKIYRLTVSSSGEEKTTSRKKVVIEGVNVVLECDLENSQTEFYWETPNSQPIFPQDFSHSRIHVTSNGNLNIKGVQSTDSGKYTCNAHSSLDVNHKSIWLEVSKHQLEFYPVISVPCQNVTVVRGANINLRCEVIGDDVIKIIWYRGLNIKHRMVPGDKVLFPTKDSLKIIDSDVRDDSNFYSCEAVNDQGRKATWTCSVTVIDRYKILRTNNPLGELPLPPVVQSPRNIKATTLDLAWSSMSNSDPDIEYWIEYVHFGTHSGWAIYQKSWKSTHITVRNLRPDTWYQFLVRSKNQAGIGRASVPTEYVKTQRDDKHSGDIGFSFSKIKLHVPRVLVNQDTELSWSLDKVASLDEKPSSSGITKFFLEYGSVSILQCIVAMSNGFQSEPPSDPPSLGNFCSLRSLTSERLRFIKNSQSNHPRDSTKVRLPIDFSRINLTKTKGDPRTLDSFAKMSWILRDLPAFQCFNVSILSDREFRTVRSNSRLVLTSETRPSRPPQNVQISWVLPEVSITVDWQVPGPRHWNGVLTGSTLYMKSNESELLLKYNESRPRILIKRVNSDLDWVFQASLSNCMGDSDKSAPVVLKRLTASLGVTRPSESVFRRSWVIASLVATSLLIWIMLCLLTVYLCCVRSKEFRTQKQLQTIHNNHNDPGQTRVLNIKENMIDNLVHQDPGQARVVTMKENLGEKMVDKTDLVVPHDSTEEKSSSAKSSGQSSSPSSVSYCNPYASTQLFEGAPDNKPSDLNLFYLSTPIFEAPIPVNNTASVPPLNYYLSNVPDWVGNPILTNSFQQKPKIFPFHFPEEFRRNSNSDLTRTPKDKPHFPDDCVMGNQNGTIGNLLMSSAPFSDQFSSSSKGKSTPNSSNSDSTHHLTHVDLISRYGPPNIHSKSLRRRQEVVDLCGDQSTEMTHLLIDSMDRSSPSIVRVYDTPYLADSSVEGRINGLSKE